MVKQTRIRQAKRWAWGPFATRIPLIHSRIEMPDLLQGIFITLATSSSLVPILVLDYGLSFEQAITMAMIQYMLVPSSPIIFGEPYAPGWITPALPLALIFVAQSSDDLNERYQMMTALSLDLGLLLMVLGLSGLSEKLISKIPNAFKAGIVLGAAIAALKRVFSDDIDKFLATPITVLVAVFLCLLLTYSTKIHRHATSNGLLRQILRLGLLPGFLVAAIVGPLVGEINYEIQTGFFMPEFTGLWQKVSPLWIGWPSLEMFIQAFPLALVTYTILFGDIVTGTALISEAQADRPDDPIDTNPTRTHLSVSIRNIVMSVVAPFFPSQGCLWAGAQVVLLNRWRKGPEEMQTLHSGIGSYYLLGLPLPLLFLPMLGFLKPLLIVALALTLLLTGFACAGVAMNMLRNNIETGVALFIAVALVFLAPWQALLIGLILCVLLIDNSETTP